MMSDASFAQGLNFYKLSWVFFLGCFLGVVIETIWCLLRYRKLESRKGLVWGPFNLVYGFGALVITVGLYPLRDSRDLFIFVAGSLLGGIFEYVCSVIQEKVTGTISWDYKDFPLNLNGRINLLYCFFWGILALLWVKDAYPFLARLIEQLPNDIGIPLTWIGVVFFIIDSLHSAFVVRRMNERQNGIYQTNRLGRLLDKYYPDEKVRKIYPNMRFNPEFQSESTVDDKSEA